MLLRPIIKISSFLLFSGALLLSAVLFRGFGQPVDVATAKVLPRTEVPRAPTLSVPTMKVATQQAPHKPRALRDGIARGDRLKLTFNELIDLPETPLDQRTPPKRGPTKTFLQRSDLSSEQLVDQNGFVSVPRLGRFRALDQSPADLEAAFGEAFRRLSGRAAEVSVVIIERLPVVVSGQVRVRGAVKYIPNMLAIHALALAGDLDVPVANTAEFVEVHREKERVDKLTAQIQRLDVRLARLEAERDDAAEFKPPHGNAALGDTETIARPVALEQALLSLDVDRRQQNEQERATAFEAARKEVEALQLKITQIDSRRTLNTALLKDYESLARKGLATGRSHSQAQNEAATVEASRQDVIASLAAAEARLEVARQASKKAAFERRERILKSIADVDAERADLKIALRSATVLVQRLNARIGGTQTATAAGRPGFEIVRQGDTSMIVIEADAMTPLQPGDLVRVVSDAGAKNNRF